MTENTKNHKILTKDDILSHSSCKHVRFDVAELGGAVYLYEMNVKEREAYFENVKKDDKLFREKTLVYALRAEGGEALFEEDDTEALSQISGAVAERILAKWLALNGFGGRSLEEAEKN
jgi:hypothetical protein